MGTTNRNLILLSCLWIICNTVVSAEQSCTIDQVRIYPKHGEHRYSVQWKTIGDCSTIPIFEYGNETSQETGYVIQNSEGYEAELKVKGRMINFYRIKYDEAISYNVSLPSEQSLIISSDPKNLVTSTSAAVFHHIGSISKDFNKHLSSSLVLSTPQTQVMPKSPNSYYSYKYGSLTVISLDTSNLLRASSSSQQGWLKTELKRARYHSRTNAIIVIGDHPLYCYGKLYRCDVDAAELRGLIEPLLYRHKVTAYISSCLSCGLNYSRSFAAFDNNKTLTSSHSRGVIYFSIPKARVQQAHGHTLKQEHTYHNPQAVLAHSDDVHVGTLIVNQRRDGVNISFVDDDGQVWDSVDVDLAQEEQEQQLDEVAREVMDGGLQFGVFGVMVVFIAFVSLGASLYYGSLYSEEKFRMQRSDYIPLSETEMH